MTHDELSPSQLDCVFRTMEALRNYIFEVRSSRTGNKELMKALNYIEKADTILEAVGESNIQVMYGPLETIFSPKELAEMRLRDEVMRQVEHADLTAEQWKELVSDLTSDENIDFRIIKDLLESTH